MRRANSTIRTRWKQIDRLATGITLSMMTPKERDEWRIANAAAMMNVTDEEAARRLDEVLGPQWREASSKGGTSETGTNDSEGLR